MHLEKLLNAAYPTTPYFTGFWLNDHNPLSGHTKTRFISNPNGPMRTIHASLIKHLRSLRIPLPSSTACRPKSSALNNVRRHIGSRHFYLLDLRNAYGSVRLDALADILCSVDRHNGVSVTQEVLRRFAISDDGTGRTGLIVGAPASPGLFNIYAEVTMDRQLRAIALRHRLIYTRYLDDLTFSGHHPIGEEKRREMRTVIEAAGFAVNHRKSQVLDLDKGSITLNGVGLTRGGKTFLPRHGLDRLRGMLHRALTKRDVKPAVIHGTMGMFRHLTFSKKGMNQTEKKVWNTYRQFCSLRS